MMGLIAGGTTVRESNALLNTSLPLCSLVCLSGDAIASLPLSYARHLACAGRVSVTIKRHTTT